MKVIQKISASKLVVFKMASTKNGPATENGTMGTTEKIHAVEEQVFSITPNQLNKARKKLMKREKQKEKINLIQ